MTTEYRKPLPIPTPDTQAFWDGLKQREVRLRQCNDCSRFHHHPRSLCPYCASTNLGWKTVSGRGKLYTFTVNYRPPRGWDQDDAPVVAIVQLEEGIKLHTELVNVSGDPTQLKIGTPVEPVFDAVTAEVTLLKYRLA